MCDGGLDMEMNFGHWMALESAMQSDQPRRRSQPCHVDAGSSAFARPHRRKLTWFLVFSVIGAVLTVATPVLAGQVVDQIVNDGSVARDRVAGDRDRLRRGAPGRDLDRRAVAVGADRRGSDPRPATHRVRPRAADAGGVLHAHPHGGAGEPSEQRRDRRPAGVHVDVVGCRVERDLAACWRWR